jgi:glycosyltransferase involved in cell wall biosynthesis
LNEMRQGDADFLFACAQAVEYELSARASGIPVRTVWNGIAKGPFADAGGGCEAGAAWRKSRGWNGDDFIIVAVANPRPQKQLHRLPSILRELQGLWPGRNVRLVIVGAHLEGSVEARAAVAKTEAEAARCGTRDQVHWTGGTKDVADILAASDVLVSASAYEGLSLAHLEALAAGLPVVATAVGGTPEIARQSPAMRLVAPTATAREFAEEIARTAWKWQENGKAPELPPSFHRYQMAARVRRLYPRVIERARGLGKGEEVWLIANNFPRGARNRALAACSRGSRQRV